MKSLLFRRSLLIFSVAVLLMALEGFALFFNGAYFLGPMTLCVTGGWALLAALSLADPRSLVARSAWILLAAGTLGAFWLWTGLSVFWSISADLTWNEFNRTGGYLAVFLIGLVLARDPRVRELSLKLFVAVSAAAALYSLGPKVAPSVIDNLDELARSSIPIGYANAQGLVAAMAFMPALYLAAQNRIHWSIRMGASLSLPVFLVSLFFTISRGATFAIAVGLLAYFVLVPLRLRSFAVLVLAVIPSLLICFWGSAQDALMHDKSDLSSRIDAAATLRLYLVAALLSVAVPFAISLFLGKRITFPTRLKTVCGASLLGALCLAAAISTVLFFSSQPSVSEWANRTWEDFTTVRGTEAGASRLLQVNSSVRWNLWHEALDNWSLHPFTGSGAQSFPITHLMTRKPNMPFVKQAHSMPFGLLSELGLVGFILMGTFVWLTLALGTVSLLKSGEKQQRAMMAALIALLVTYLVHSSFDWDWNMFALTLPYFFFAGILVGWRSGHGRRREKSTIKKRSTPICVLPD